MNFVFAFLVGGLLCIPAQILIDKTNLTPARILVLYLVSGVFLGAVGIYPLLFDFAGAGASVPLLGFGGGIAKGVREAVDKEGALGILTGPLTAGSAGIGFAISVGYILSIFFKSRPKRVL